MDKLITLKFFKIWLTNTQKSTFEGPYGLLKVKWISQKIVKIAYLAVALGPLACLAAMLGPLACLAAMLGPLAGLAQHSAP